MVGWVTLLVSVVGASANPPADADHTDAIRDRPINGIWPTTLMIDGVLARWADDLALRYDLDEDAARRLQHELSQDWRKFIHENRPVLQPLLNEYVEARLALGPPDPEVVRTWSERAGPVLSKIERQLHNTRRDLRARLDPVRQGMLDVRSIEANAMLKILEAKLEAWKQGRFETHEWWDETARSRQEAARRAEPHASTASSKVNSRIDTEMRRWDYFLRQFVQRYLLDDTQSQAAYSIARECKQRALEHRDRYRARLATLEKSVGDATEYTTEQSAEFNAMYGPIDALFAEMKTRLEQIPTTEQVEREGTEGEAETTAPGQASSTVDDSVGERP